MTLCCRRRLLRCFTALNCSSSANTRRRILQLMTSTVPMKVSPSPASTRFKVHRLCATDVTFHSRSDSRDTLHLTRHHPIRAQSFTIRSYSTAQVPCSCLGSTCRDVSSQPPCVEIFVMEGHISTVSQFYSSFLCPTYQRDPGVPFSKIGPT